MLGLGLRLWWLDSWHVVVWLYLLRFDFSSYDVFVLFVGLYLISWDLLVLVVMLLFCVFVLLFGFKVVCYCCVAFVLGGLNWDWLGLFRLLCCLFVVFAWRLLLSCLCGLFEFVWCLFYCLLILVWIMLCFRLNIACWFYIL